MDDIRDKNMQLVDDINRCLNALSARAHIKTELFNAEDTGETMHSVVVVIDGAEFMAYASGTNVGIKTFLQGFYMMLTLVHGEYSMKPLSFKARKTMRASILPERRQGTLFTDKPEPEPKPKKRFIWT